LVQTPAGGTWLSVSNTSGISASVSPGNLAPGEYCGSVLFNVGNGRAEAAVRLIVTTPSLTVPANPIDFTVGATTAITSRCIPIGSTGGPLPFTAAITNLPGVTLSANAGITPATLILTSNAFGVTAGNYTGTLTISAPSPPSNHNPLL
jgi:hypothetical protein